MTNISSIDKNFEVKTNIGKPDIKFYNIDDKPFKTYGVFRENGKYRRMPEDVALSVSPGVHALHANTAGGRVRFCTNSKYVAINVTIPSPGKMPHFAFSGSIGFDLYVDTTYTGSFIPPVDIKDGYESVVNFPNNEMREITINMPLYSDVSMMYIGIEEDADLTEAKPYKLEKPILYYGSSITQGGCASRPGTSYQSIVSRRLDCNYINLGFSGNAKAEDNMIDYIKKQDMSVFVCDYDHNAPSTEHLQNTHEKLYKAVRKEKADIPIIFMTRPKYILTEEEIKRQEIVETTYKNALAQGDKNVYFLKGRDLTRLCLFEGTVDNCHPTDLGFMSMAMAVGDVLEEIIKKF